jgi:hypothetical protein
MDGLAKVLDAFSCRGRHFSLLVFFLGAIFLCWVFSPASSISCRQGRTRVDDDSTKTFVKETVAVETMMFSIHLEVSPFARSFFFFFFFFFSP